MADSYVEMKLRILAGILLLGFGIALLYHPFLSPLFGKGYPYNTYLFQPGDRFNDLVNLVRKTAAGNPYLVSPEIAPFAYFPFAYLLLLPFSLVPRGVYLVVFVLGSVLIALLLARWVAVRAGLTKTWVPTVSLFIVALLNYPFQFALDRGNVDLFIGFLCSAFAILCWKKRFWLSTPFLAMAMALKGYPAVFLLLLVICRQPWPACGTVLQVLLFTFLAMLALPGGFAVTMQGLLTNFAIYKKDYILGVGSMHFSSDLFNLIKIQVHLGHLKWNPEKILPWYSLVMSGIVFLAGFYALFAETPKWKKILFLTLAALFFPHITNDYKLVILLIPAVAMVVEPQRSANDLLLLVILALLLIPKAYGRIILDASVSCLINPILLCILCTILLAEKGVMSRAVKELGPKLKGYFPKYDRRSGPEGSV